MESTIRRYRRSRRPRRLGRSMRAGLGAGFEPLRRRRAAQTGPGFRRGLSSYPGVAIGNGLAASMPVDRVEPVREFRSRRPRRAAQGTATRLRVAATSGVRRPRPTQRPRSKDKTTPHDRGLRARKRGMAYARTTNATPSPGFERQDGSRPAPGRRAFAARRDYGARASTFRSTP
jgi:hypothetical protein